MSLINTDTNFGLRRKNLKKDWLLGKYSCGRLKVVGRGLQIFVDLRTTIINW